MLLLSRVVDNAQFLNLESNRTDLFVILHFRQANKATAPDHPPRAMIT